jgi:hypothetical protein
MGYTRNIKDSIRRLLYANSGNICAMYGCNNQLIYENTSNLSEICHIEAVNEDGARHNHNSSNEEVNSYENLILLCPTCHKKVDAKKNEALFPVNYLKRMKRDHESRVREAILERPAFDVPVIVRNIDVSKVVNDYNLANEQDIECNNVYKTIEKALTLQPALRSVLYAITEQCYENDTNEIKMPLVWRMSNLNEYQMASILETLTEMKFIEEVYYVGMLESMVEDENGDVIFMNNNYLYKLVNGKWFLKRKGKILMFIRSIIDDQISFYRFMIYKDVTALEKA